MGEGMISVIEQILTNELRNRIVQQIQVQFFRFKQYQQEENRLYYAPYATVRRKHTLTAAVLSGFAPDRFIANGIEVTDVQYGLNNTLGQPELHSVNAIIQIYSNGSDLSANVIKERCQQYNQDETSRPQFLLIVFYSNSKQELTRIEAKYPNAAGNIIETKSLYSNISSIANVG